MEIIFDINHVCMRDSQCVRNTVAHSVTLVLPRHSSRLRDVVLGAPINGILEI